MLADALVARAQSDSVTPWTVALQASSVHGTLQVRILEWVAIPFSRGIFLTQGLNPSVLHCRQILHCLSHRKSQAHAHGYLIGCQRPGDNSALGYIKEDVLGTKTH